MTDWRVLDEAIDDLKGMLHPGLASYVVEIFTGRTSGQELWTKAAEVQDLFRAVRYPTGEQRRAAWQRFNELRDEIRSRSHEQRQTREDTSHQHRESIVYLVESARPNDLLGFDPVTRDEMKALSRPLKEAGERLSELKLEMLPEDKRHCFEEITLMRSVHDAWWERFRGEASRRHSDRRERIETNLEKNREKTPGCGRGARAMQGTDRGTRGEDRLGMERWLEGRCLAQAGGASRQGARHRGVDRTS